MLDSLKYRDYRLLWLASLSAGGAAWALIVARAWLVYTLSGSSVWVGVVTFTAMAPMFLAPPIAGYMADKFNRRNLIAILFTVQFTHNAVLVVLSVTDVIVVWHIIVLSFINGFARASQMPAGQALLPNLVPKDNLLNAISLNAATTQGSRLVGPALVSPLMAMFGPVGAFSTCTLFYIFSFILVLNIKTVSYGSMDKRESAFGNFFAGLRFIYGHSLVLPLMITVFLHCCLTMSFESLLPVLSEGFFSDGGGGVGANYIMMSVGTGALILVLAIAGVKNLKLRGRFLFVTAVFSGLGSVLLGMAPTVEIVLLGGLVMGGSQAAYMAISGAVVQMAAPDYMRGRVMSVYLWHIGGMMASFNLINATVADRIGASPVFIVTGLVFILTIFISFLSKPLRDLYIRGKVDY
ncbi:MFS transporter [Dehalococcoidia bacterium]|nr:MFS transporter [Dehalococcoidia bacterium]